MGPMAEVNFQYTGQLAAAAGATEETRDVEPGTALSPALEALVAGHGEGFGSLIFQTDGRLRTTLLVVFDGVQMTGARETLLLDGVGSVMLMTPIAGG
jgi:hypothetical protein